MRIFDNLLDSYNNKNWAEFEELCKSTLSMSIPDFWKLQDFLDMYPDMDEAYNQAFRNHPEWGDED
jgi:hypothetical protein